MSLLARIAASNPATPEKRDPADDFWYSPIGIATAAGMPVTSENALQLTTPAACLKRLAVDVAKLPLVVFRKKSDGSKERIDNHPAAQLMRSPNGRETSFDFRGQMQWDLAWHSNAYAEIRPGARGFADELHPLPAGNVSAKRNAAGAVTYEIVDGARPGYTRLLREDQVWHLRALPYRTDRLTGKPVYETHSEVLGAALACQDYAARFFKNDAKTGGVVEMPATHKWKDDESRRNWIAAWQAAATAANRHRDRVLEFGSTYQRIAATPDESQFIQTKNALDVAICRIWDMPPHKVGILDRATFSNIEQQALEYVIDTLLSWLVLWEQKISADLILEDDVFAEFNVAGLLRGDLKSRYEAYSLARNWGWLSVNEIRRLENMNPIDDGDEYLRPLNTVPLGEEFPRGTEPANGKGKSPQDDETDAAKPNGHAKEGIHGHA